MSIVAWDGKTLAADKQMTYYGNKSVCSKIEKRGDVIFAGTGTANHLQPLIEWYEKGANPNDYPKFQDTDNWSRLIVVKDGICLEYLKDPYPIPVMQKFMAFGSGANYAIGAMQMGADAIKAVEVASLHDDGCGFGVEFYHA